MSFNQTVLDGLPDGDYSTAAQTECFLIEYASGEAEAAVARLWTFLYNPSLLSYSREARYAEAATYGAVVPQQQYQNSTGKTLELQNIVIDGWWHGKSVMPLLEGLDALIEVRQSEDQQAPPIMSLVMGDRVVLAPCILTRITVRESGWLAGGAAARATADLTLLEVPSEAIDRGQGTAPPTPNENSQGLPRLPLTERQRQDGSAAAKAHLAANLQRFSPELRTTIQQNAYFLATDSETGNVTIYDASRNKIGTVGRWDGQAFNVEGIQDLPLTS
ncbi:MAG TPA: hypothetical protein V6D06_04395 [Trichocoleus sp.]